MERHCTKHCSGETARASGADKAGVEAAGKGDVRGAMDERAPIGKDGQSVGATAETKQQRVGSHVREIRVGGQLPVHGGEINGTLMLVDLNGVAAAKRDVGTGSAGKMDEAAVVADLTARAWIGGGDLGMVEAGCSGGLPKIEGDKGSAKEMMLSGEDFQGFGDLQGRREVDRRRENAHRVAGLNRTRRRLRKDASEAGSGLELRLTEWWDLTRRRCERCRPGKDCHGGGVGTNSGGINPGKTLLHSEVVEQIAGFEVVGSVEEQIRRAEQILNVSGNKIRYMCGDVD